MFEDRGGQVAGVAITFLILSWVTVGLRCYVRTCLVKSFGLDDQAMVVTLLLFTGYLICQLGGAIYGTGQRRENLSDENAQTALRYWFFCEVFYTMATCMLKIAVGLFLLRITIVPLHVWIIRLIMMVAAFLGVAYTLLVLFQCNPISAWWDLDPNHQGTCLSASLVMIFTFVVSGLNSFADWTFGILPIFIVKDLQMKTRAKVLVSSIIGLAAIGSSATIIRLPYTTTLKPYKGDFLYRTTDFAIWTTVEVGIGITAGCIATLRPLLKATLGSTANSSGKWWSRKKSSHQNSLTLDKLRPSNAVRVTTVTGGRASSDSDKEEILGKSNGGINKSVSTTVVEERAVPNHTMHGGRRGSLGGNSNSSLGDEGRGKPVYIHDRF